MPRIHKGRVSALSAVVEGAFQGRTLSVTGLGRAIQSAAKMKHCIKRADRLCSNPHLHIEREYIYERISHQILGSNRQPVVLIDWSDIDARREFFLLRASVAIKGRSLTLYEEVHSKQTKERRSTHNSFLRKLKQILPKECKPIIVTDAGFCTPWFKQVQSLSWDFVGRVRNREMVQISRKSSWIGAKALYLKATNTSSMLPGCLLTRSNPLLCSLVLFKRKPKKRKRHTKMGQVARNHTSLVCSARAREPWLLATSLASYSPRSIVEIYSTRMQIEETFRDLKCTRFGLSLYHNRTYKLERMQILVMLGSIATNFACMLGQLARSLNIHRQFQANTAYSTHVLSDVFLGMQILRNSKLKIPWYDFHKQVQSINQYLFQTA